MKELNLSPPMALAVGVCQLVIFLSLIFISVVIWAIAINSVDKQYSDKKELEIASS